MHEIKQSVRSFITQNFYVPGGLTASDHVSLRDLGIVDSTGVLEVILFLENAYAIQVDDSEIVPENLDSIDAIARFIERKQGPNADRGA